MRYRVRAQIVMNYLPGTLERNKSKTPTVLLSPWETREAANNRLAAFRNAVESPDWTFAIESETTNENQG